MIPKISTQLLGNSVGLSSEATAPSATLQKLHEKPNETGVQLHTSSTTAHLGRIRASGSGFTSLCFSGNRVCR